MRADDKEQRNQRKVLGRVSAVNMIEVSETDQQKRLNHLIKLRIQNIAMLNRQIDQQAILLDELDDRERQIKANDEQSRNDKKQLEDMIEEKINDSKS